MASILGSDVFLHGGNFEMLSLDVVDEARELSVPDRRRNVDVRLAFAGRAGCGRSSLLALESRGRKQNILN